MNEEQRGAYVRTLLAARALQTRETVPAGATALEAVSVADVLAWGGFALRVRHRHASGAAGQETSNECQLSRVEQDVERCRTWTRLLGFLAEAVTDTLGPDHAADPPAWMVRLHELLPIAQCFLTAAELARLACCLRGAQPPVQGTGPRPDVRASPSPPPPPPSASDALAVQVAAAVARGTAAMHSDVLQIGWGLVNPKLTPLLVMSRLEVLGPLLAKPTPPSPVGRGLLYSHASTLTACTKEELRDRLDATDTNPNKSALVHPRCLEPLLACLEAAGGGGAAGEPVILLPVEVQSTLAHVLVRVAYDMVTKLDARMVESGYYTLPLFIDFTACCSPVVDAAPAVRAELQRAQDALRAALTSVYADQLAACLVDYRKELARQKPLVTVPKSSVKLSRAAFEVLHGVMEPSMNVLRRYTGSSALRLWTPQLEAASALRGLLLDLVSEVWADLEGEGRELSQKAAARAKGDRDIIVTYMMY